MAIPLFSDIIVILLPLFAENKKKITICAETA